MGDDAARVPADVLDGWGPWVRTYLPAHPNHDVDKFEEEAREFLDARSVEEAADVVLTLLAWAARSGVDLFAEAARKVEVNKRRVWHRWGDGTWHHYPERQRIPARGASDG